jgi:hypothetical protein
MESAGIGMGAVCGCIPNSSSGSGIRLRFGPAGVYNEAFFDTSWFY